jgi:hypothetical protein
MCGRGFLKMSKKMASVLALYFFVTMCSLFFLRVKAYASTEFGFTTHVSGRGYNLNLKTFKQNVDDLITFHQQWIRIGMWSGEIAPSGTPDSINWENLDTLDEAVTYANSKGLKIYMTTSVPTFAKDYILSDYLTVTKNYYDFLVHRYASKVVVWQVFNEVNGHNYRDYSTLSALTTQYLNELNQVVVVVKDEIKKADPGALVTMNVSGYPITDQTQSRWFQFFDVLKDNLDIISLDLYPDVNHILQEAATMGQRTTNVMIRYQKPVMITETGVCTRTSQSNENTQIEFLPIYVETLKQANPAAILIYEIQDENNKPNTCEGSFGIKRYDGTKKPAFDLVMKAMTVSTGNCLQCLGDPTAKGKGDADCSGGTTINDASIWRAEFISGVLGTTVKNTWQADFDCNGKVTINDISIWRTNFIKGL